MRSHGLGMIAAIACASLGIAGAMPSMAEDIQPIRPRTPKRKHGQQHAGSREIARRQRQQARLAARAGA